MSLPVGLVEMPLQLPSPCAPRVRTIATSDLCKQDAVLTSALLVTSAPVDQLGVLVKVEVAVLKVHVSLNVRSESRIKSPGVPGLTTSLMFLSWVELAAREVHAPVHFNGQERADESHSP